mgnify:CR=1 FL=1
MKVYAHYEWMGKESKVPRCCAMTNGEQCDAPAEFAIYGESAHPDDNTESCEAHVGALLGSPLWLKKENSQWTVVFIAKDTP